MNTRTIAQKLKSTKLWVCIAGVVLGIALALGVEADEVEIICGAVTSVVSLVTYIITEGKIDAAAVSQTVEAVEKAVEVVCEEEE